MERRPTVAVVIPSWNCVSDLSTCIESVRGQEEVELELMVVDNGSTDGTLDYLAAAGIPHIPLHRNLGFAPAMNIGIGATSAPYVMVLNSDTLLEPGALAELAAGLEQDLSLGGVQPRILHFVRGGRRDSSDPSTVVYSLGQALTADGRAREVGEGLQQGVPPAEKREIFGVCGAAAMLRREMLERVGGFDERYFAFYEDVDLNVRARILGWRFRLEPGAVVWHLGNASWSVGFKRPDAENARLVARNRIATQVKFMSLGSLPRILGVEVGALFRAARQRRFLLTVSGKIAVLRWVPDLIRKRRALMEEGDPELARAWLGQSRRPVLGLIKKPPGA